MPKRSGERSALASSRLMIGWGTKGKGMSFRMEDSRTLLVISQVYVPDPAAVGQHMHDAAVEMVGRGWNVTVLTSGRGYEDPTVRYPAREMRDGVRIVRLPWSSLGKKTILHRLAGQGLFLLQAILWGLFLRGLNRRTGRILVSTSPPMASIAALVIHAIRRTPIKFWLMDLNPDQAVALGKVRAGSLPVKLFDALNRRLYRSAQDIVVLDRFMADRVNAKLPVREKITVLPPWAHEEHLESVPHEANPFRREHGLEGKFVFMYSGNMSIASPLTTVLQAAMRLKDDPRLFFMFIGGGLGKKDVESVMAEHRPNHIACLPYQPMSQLKYSLSAADVHLVTLGDSMVGIVHPCKVYGAMAVARPVLLVGPDPSHVSDMLVRDSFGWQVKHGDVDGLVELFRRVARTDPQELAAMGRKAHALLGQRYAKQRVCQALGNVLAK